MFVVYVLKSSATEKSYVGMTTDINRRLKEHNAGKHFYTRRHIPWVVVRTESLPGREEARARERYLKSAAGRRFLERVFATLE
ncbi:MAG: endonuclease [Bacteroidetes bacterium RIFCSPHIGHO2_02_FULL_44_7]|nr:MAG: endonuclease [Bacteroidetes bacterium RIFCSPHIGHO2_02_FULL_44_7]